MRRRCLHGLKTVTALLAVMALTAGCFGSAGEGSDVTGSPRRTDAGPPQPGGIYRMAIPADAPSLNPITESISSTHIAVGFVYGKLVDYKTGPELEYGSNELEGDLAETWETSPDLQTWTFHLRKGVTFHDKPPVNGREFTSKDVACTIDAIKDRGQQKGEVSTVKTVETPDDYTVVFRLAQSYPDFAHKLAGHFLWMLPCEATEGKFDLSKQAIGTGPFQLDKWVPDKERVYSKNPKYHEPGKPYMDGLRIVVVPDNAAAAAALRTKTIDYVATINDKATVQQLLKSNPDLTVFNELTFAPLMVYMNQGQKPFDDLRVRQAVAYAIDRKNMMKSLRPDGLLSGPVTPKLFGALTPEEAEKLQPYNPEKAKQLLAEAGYPDGITTKLLVTNGYSDTVVREAQWVQQDLEKVGIKAEIDMQDYATYFTKSFAGKRYAIGAGLQTPWLTADDYLMSMWHSKGTRNWFNIADPTLDKMIEEQRGITDTGKREAALEEIQRYILANVANPYILYVYHTIVLYGSYVNNSWPAPEYGSRHLKDVWLSADAPGRRE